jgi:hypothetical protein
VSANLRAAFPEIKGFSRSNLKYMRAFAEAWPDLQAANHRLANCCRRISAWQCGTKGDLT